MRKAKKVCKFENLKSLLFTSFFSKVDTFVSNCLPIIPSLINKLDEAWLHEKNALGMSWVSPPQPPDDASNWIIALELFSWDCKMF